MREWSTDDPDHRDSHDVADREVRIAQAREAVEKAVRERGPAPDYADRDLPITDTAVSERTSDHRVNLADDVPDAALVPVYGGYLDLIMHGDHSGTQAAINGQRVDFTLDETVRLIEDSPEWNDQPIRLMSCSTGQAEYAQDLAERLGVPVYAPDDVLNVAGGKNVILHDGAWRRFEPSPEAYTNRHKTR